MRSFSGTEFGCVDSRSKKSMTSYSSPSLTRRWSWLCIGRSATRSSAETTPNVLLIPKVCCKATSLLCWCVITLILLVSHKEALFETCKGSDVSQAYRSSAWSSSGVELGAECPRCWPGPQTFTSRDSESWYCFQRVCLWLCMFVNKQNTYSGSGEVSCLVVWTERLLLCLPVACRSVVP